MAMRIFVKGCFVEFAMGLYLEEIVLRCSGQRRAAPSRK